MPPRSLTTAVATDLTKPENLENLQKFYTAEYDKARMNDPATARRYGRTLDMIDAAIAEQAAPKATGTTIAGGEGTPPKTASAKTRT